MTDTSSVAPADGKLGVLCVGLGAVTSTLIAGVELSKKGLAEPVGSLTQMGTIRLGKRYEYRVPRIKDFVPLAALEEYNLQPWVDKYKPGLQFSDCNPGFLYYFTTSPTSSIFKLITWLTESRPIVTP